MSRLKLLAIPCLLLSLEAAGRAPPAPPPPPGVTLVIHGGAGVIDPAKMTPEKEASYRAGLAAALDAGYAILERGGSSLDAVTAAVRMLEDDPQFNAGRGAVLNHAGEAELDAAIMDARGPRAGAVAGVMHVRNPIELARLVMERSPHVMLIGLGAEEFALEQGLVLVPNDYFKTRARLQQLQEEQQAEGAVRTGADSQSKGTVGAVALDRDGNLAAATSTGGISNKHRGRVGDTPIIGAGTYASPGCAVSGTGDGEYFIRAVLAYDICATMAYRKVSLAAAVNEVIHQKLEATGGKGGVIALDAAGNVVMDFNSVGMFRAARDAHGRREIAMYHETQSQ